MTILDSELTNLDGLDKAYHPLYTQREGKFVLTGVKGYTPEDRERMTRALETERGNAKKYDQELKTLRPWKVFADKKPDEIQAQLDRIEELEAAASGKIDKAELEKMATARAEAATKPLQRQLKELESKLTESSEKLSASEKRVVAYERAEERAAIRAEIQKAALASNALPESYADGGGLLAVLEGALEIDVQVDSDGTRRLGAVRSKDGAGYPSGLDVSKLLQQIQTRQGYFWGTSKGGGANSGNGGTRGGSSGDPWDPKTLNFTKQLEMIRDNPERAKQLAAAHGVKLGI